MKFTKEECFRQAIDCSTNRPDLIFEVREISNDEESWFRCDVPEHFINAKICHGMTVGQRCLIMKDGKEISQWDDCYPTRELSIYSRRCLEETLHFKNCDNIFGYTMATMNS